MPETTGIKKEDVLIVEDGQGTKKGTVQQLDEALGVSQLKEDLSEYKNGYIHMPIVEKEYVRIDGVTQPDPNWSRTDYIDCSNYESLHLTNCTKHSIYNAFYDSDKSFISSFSIDVGDNELTIPSGAKYFMLSNASADLPNTKLVDYSKIKYQKDIDGINDSIDTIDLRLQNVEEVVKTEKEIKLEFENGYYIDSSTGEAKTDSSWKFTDYILIENGAKSLKISTNYDRLNVYNAFYDSNNSYIARLTINASADGQIVNIPDGTKYIRLSTVKSNTLSISVTYKTVNDSIEEIKGTVEETKVTLSENEWTIKRNKLPTIKSISRMGYCAPGSGIPNETIGAFKSAIKMGYDVIRCNYRVTSDGVPVSVHDETLNSNNARMKNGDVIENPVAINSLTYSEIINNYNYYSKEISKTFSVMKLEDIVKLCKMTGTILYVEMKIIPTNEQCDVLISIVKKYGMEKYVQFIGYNYSKESVNAIKYIVDHSNVSRVGIMGDYFNDSVIQRVGTLKTEKNSVFIWGWNTMDTTDYIDVLIENNVEFEMGTVDKEEDIISYFETESNNYCTGVESNRLLASEVIVANCFSN